MSFSFTQTVPVVKLSTKDIVPLPEIVRNGYAFSDGCGVMGIGVAKRVQDAFRLPELPGAIQIRISGVKGMLSLKPNSFPSDKIGIRPSMVKFPSKHCTLEVKKVAKANTNPENKLFSQIILIMSHRGVCSKLNRRRDAKATCFFCSHPFITLLSTSRFPRKVVSVKSKKLLVLGRYRDLSVSHHCFCLRIP